MCMCTCLCVCVYAICANYKCLHSSLFACPSCPPGPPHEFIAVNQTELKCEYAWLKLYSKTYNTMYIICYSKPSVFIFYCLCDKALFIPTIPIPLPPPNSSHPPNWNVTGFSLCVSNITLTTPFFISFPLGISSFPFRSINDDDPNVNHTCYVIVQIHSMYILLFWIWLVLERKSEFNVCIVLFIYDFLYKTSSQPLLYYYFGFTYNRRNTSHPNPFTYHVSPKLCIYLCCMYLFLWRSTHPLIYRITFGWLALLFLFIYILLAFGLAVVTILLVIVYMWILNMKVMESYVRHACLLHIKQCTLYSKAF